MDLVLFGTGGHGRETHRVVVDWLAAGGGPWTLRGWLDDAPERHGTTVHGLPVVGGVDWLADQPQGTGVVIAVGNPRARRALAARCAARGAVFPTVVHPRAWIGGGVTLGAGVILFPGAQASTEITIGDHTHLNQGVTVSHDGRIGSFVSLAPGVHLAGNVTIGDGVDVFTGASAIPGAIIGAGAVVGAGATVTHRIPADTIAAGVPARVLRPHPSPWDPPASP